jgi:hypothetical protein
LLANAHSKDLQVLALMSLKNLGYRTRICQQYPWKPLAHEIHGDQIIGAKVGLQEVDPQMAVRRTVGK